MCFTEFSTKIYWNTRLAASEVFHILEFQESFTIASVESIFDSNWRPRILARHRILDGKLSIIIILFYDCFQEIQMKKLSKNKTPFFAVFSKKDFSENLSSYYKLSNILYFTLVSKFLTFMKRLERFLTIGWLVGEELIKENSYEKRSQLHT